MKKILTFVAICVSLLLNSQNKSEMSKAIDLASIQRVLVQQMAKDKLFIEVNNKTSVAEKELEQAIISFEKNLETLKNLAPNKKIKHEIQEEEFAYRYYKHLILQTTKKSMHEIVDYNSVFLAICDDVVKEFTEQSFLKNTSKNEKYLAENINKATSAAHRIKLLSQRLTLYYALNNFKFTKVETKKIQRMSMTIENKLNYLTLLEFNTLDIDDSLGELVFLWNLIKTKISDDKEALPADELFDLCNLVLNKAEITSELYLNLNKKT